MNTDLGSQTLDQLQALITREKGSPLSADGAAEAAAMLFMLARHGGRADTETLLPAKATDVANAAHAVDEREVTILVADLRGFVALTATQPAGVIVSMLNQCLETLGAVIARCQGTIDKFSGDSITVLFGAPVAREDDVQRALVCAAEMQVAMRELNNSFQRARLPELYIGIGINTGTVMAGRFGPEAFAQYTVIGNEVSLASRIEAFSLRGQVLLSESAYQRGGAGVLVTEPREVFVAGKFKPVQVRELVAIPSLRIKVPRQEFRRSHRAEVRVPCTLQLIEGKTILPTPIKASILDIGYHGVLLELDYPLELQQAVKLNFDMTLVDYPVNDVFARITKMKHEEGHLLAGLEFTALSSETNNKLQMFVQLLVGAQ